MMRKECRRIASGPCLLAAMLITVATNNAGAEGFSLDLTSATTIPAPPTPGDVLSPGPAVLIPEAAVTAGIVAFELDAVSNGNDAPIVQNAPVYFSVDVPSAGAPATAVAAEVAGALGPDHPGDIYSSLGLGTNTLFRDGNGLANPGLGIAPALGLVEPIGGMPDNVDAYDRDIGVHPVYFSWSPAAAAASPSPADIVFNPVPGGPTSLFASEAGLGLVPGDDIDALVVLDSDGSTTFTPGDFVFYSLAAGSPTLGGGNPLLPGGAVPADILTSTPLAVPSVAVPAAALGLVAATDNIDALSTQPVPEPSALVLAAMGVVGLLWWRRRK